MERLKRWLFRDYTEFYNKIDDETVKELKWESARYRKVKNAFLLIMYVVLVLECGAWVINLLSNFNLGVDILLIIVGTFLGIQFASSDDQKFLIPFGGIIVVMFVQYVNKGSVLAPFTISATVLVMVCCAPIVRNIKEISVIVSMARIKYNDKYKELNPTTFTDCFGDENKENWLDEKEEEYWMDKGY